MHSAGTRGNGGPTRWRRAVCRGSRVTSRWGRASKMRWRRSTRTTEAGRGKGRSAWRTTGYSIGRERWSTWGKWWHYMRTSHEYRISFTKSGLKVTSMTHCPGIRVEGAPFQAEVGREGHPGDPLPLAAVAGGHQVLEGKAAELMKDSH